MQSEGSSLVLEVKDSFVMEVRPMLQLMGIEDGGLPGEVDEAAYSWRIVMCRSKGKAQLGHMWRLSV